MRKIAWVLGCATLLSLALGLTRLHRESEEEEDEARPSEWFFTQRAYPRTDIDLAARSLAQEEARAMLPATLGGPAWQEAGPTNIGGRVTAIASITGSNTIFAGAAAGGVFRSLDGGASWTPVFDSIGVPSIGALAIDPTNPSTVYVGTGEANASGDSFAGDGLFRSLDGGESWEAIGLSDTRHIGRIVIDPTDPTRIYVAAAGGLFSKTQERGIYRSTDSGASWERRLFVSDSTAAIDVAIDPITPTRLYATMWERLRSAKNRRVGGVTSGIYRSLDGGTSWTRLSTGLPAVASNVGRIGVAVAPSNPLVVYAIYADDPGNFMGLYKSTNAGDSWTRANDGALSSMYSNFGWYFGNVRVSNFDPNRVYALGLDLWRSTNGGTSWTVLSDGVHVDQHDLWIDPNSPGRLILSCDGGVYTSTTGGSPWTHRVGLPISQFYAGTIDASNPLRLYGGLQDNGTVRTPTGALDDWENIYGGDGFYCLVDPRNANVIFAESQYGNLGKSTNNGGFFFDCVSGINSSDRRNWSTPFVFDPSNPDRMFYGTYRVYRTTNGANSWTAISSDLTGGPGSANLVYATITTLAVAPTDPARIWAGTDDARVWTTSNGGTNWLNRSIGLPNLWVTRVAVDPSNAQIAYVAHSGYRSDSPTPHLHRTTNAGVSWSAIDAGLPNAPVNAIVVDPAVTSTLFVGTDVGVYVSYDAGGTWMSLAPGLPLDVIHDLTFHAASRTLVAATHGRSMYKLALGPPTATPENPAPGIGSANDLALDPPAPNPASRTETITLRFRTSDRATSELALYDASGRKRLDLPNRGDTVTLTRALLSDLSPGVYFARLTSGGRSVSRRLVLLD